MVITVPINVPRLESCFNGVFQSNRIVRQFCFVTDVAKTSSEEQAARKIPECHIYIYQERERDRERQREIERERERERQRQRQRQRDRQTEREKDRQTDRQRYKYI